MELSQAFNKIVNTKWSFANNFKIHFQGEHANMFDFLPNHGELHVINFSLDALMAEDLSIFAGGRHLQILGVEEVHSGSFKIRDYNQLSIYKQFIKIWRTQLYKYYDDYKFSIVVIKEPDYPDEREKVILTAKECYIHTVDVLQLDNENENQIFEFTVNFRTPNVSIDNFDQYALLR